MKRILTPFLLLAPFALLAQNQVPVISNFQVTPDWQNQTLELSYEVSDAENDPLEITVQFSDNGGKTYGITGLVPVSGDVGYPVQPGTRSISCDIAALSNLGNSFQVRLIADDRQAFDIQALVNEVDSNRLRADLVFVEGIRHRTAGNTHLNATRDSLKNLFLNAGLFYDEQAVPFGNYTGKNIIGTLPGTVSAEKVVINDAHYDTVSNAPGADDNGSGTVGVMEAARLLSRFPFKNSLRFIGFDLEESGLVGSIRYVSSGIPIGEEILGVFNHEMIGYWSDEPNTQTLPPGFAQLFPTQSAEIAANSFRGDFITNVGNVNSQPLSLLFSNSAQQYVPDLKVITLNVPGNGQIAPDLRRSDHAPFWDAGRQALMLTDGANFRNECYHTPGDTLDEKLNFTFLSNVVKATIAAMIQLAEIQHGSWVTENFQGNVGTNPRLHDLCDFWAYQQPNQRDGFVIQFNSCSFSKVFIELYDMKGALMLQDEANVLSPLLHTVHTNKLIEGVYVLKIRHEAGAQAQKIMLR